MAMTEVFYKHSDRELSKQTFARLKYDPTTDSFNGSEMLIAGYLQGTGMAYGIYDLKFDSQKLISEFDYSRIWGAIRTWLVEIKQDDFNLCFMQACNFLLFSKENNENKKYECIHKLDKNFHVYVHSENNLLKHGSDEFGRFIKLYYTNIH